MRAFVLVCSEKKLPIKFCLRTKKVIIFLLQEELTVSYQFNVLFHFTLMKINFQIPHNESEVMN